MATHRPTSTSDPSRRRSPRTRRTTHRRPGSTRWAGPSRSSTTRRMRWRMRWASAAIRSSSCSMARATSCSGSRARPRSRSSTRSWPRRRAADLSRLAARRRPATAHGPWARRYLVRVPADPRAGQPADPASLIDVDALIGAYHDVRPDPADPTQRVAFGTSGHRGSAFRAAFNEAHILAITEAICRYRAMQGYSGPLFIGKDTHALSEPAQRTALEVLIARGVDVRVDARHGVTPPPAVSHAILVANQDRPDGVGLADGIVVTPSHNPPDDGGFKYNPPNGGPADTDVTTWIQDEANRLLAATGTDGIDGIPRLPWQEAYLAAGMHDFLLDYVNDLISVIDLPAIAGSGLRIGVDPMGGASVDYWGEIAERYGLHLTVTNTTVDQTFGFMTVDWDGKIRMDPSSPHAMARLVGLRDQFDIALGNDADADRHGVVTPTAGLLNPNHVLSAAIEYLFGGAREWGSGVGIGKTLVSSSMIDRVAASLDRRLVEVPVGFKWFVG